MKASLIVLIVLVTCISLSSSQLGYSDPTLPKLVHETVATTTTTSPSSGGNGTINIFNQNLNTTNSPSFQNITLNKFILNSSGSFINPIEHSHNGTGDQKSFSPLGGRLVPHQTYNIIGVSAFGTIVNNTNDRPLMVEVTGLVRTSAGLADIAYFTLYVDNPNAANNNLVLFSESGIMGLAGVSTQIEHTAYLVVQPGLRYQINATTSGTGAVSLIQVWKTIL